MWCFLTWWYVIVTSSCEYRYAGCFLQEHYKILTEGITRLVYPERINWVEWVKSSLRSLLGLSHLFFNFFFFEDWKVEIASQQLGKTEAKNGSGLHESAGKKSSIPVPNWGKKSLYALSHGSKQLQAVPRSPAHDRDFQYFLTHFQGRFSLQMWKVLIWMWNLELAVIPRYNNQSKVETICILIFLSYSLLQN